MGPEKSKKSHLKGQVTSSFHNSAHACISWMNGSNVTGDKVIFCFMTYKS